MEVLPQPQAKFETPDLHKIAKGQDEVEILAFCRIVVAVWSVEHLNLRMEYIEEEAEMMEAVLLGGE